MDTVSKELGEVHILAHGIANKKGIVVEHVEDTGYLLSIVKTCNNYSKAVELIEYFVKRVEKGEIRSKTTYTKFKEFLNEIENGN